MGFSWKTLMGLGDEAAEAAKQGLRLDKGLVGDINNMAALGVKGHPDADLFSSSNGAQISRFNREASHDGIMVNPRYVDPGVQLPFYQRGIAEPPKSPAPVIGGDDLSSGLTVQPQSAPTSGLPGFPPPVVLPQSPVVNTGWTPSRGALLAGGATAGVGALGAGAYANREGIGEFASNYEVPNFREAMQWSPSSGQPTPEPTASPSSPTQEGMSGKAGTNSVVSRFGKDASPSVEEAAKSLTIKEGATLWDISKGNPAVIKAIMDANPQITDPDKIYAGASMELPTMHQYNLDNFLESM